MTITVIDSNGDRFITDFGETIIASREGEQLEIPRYGVWRNDRLGKAEVIFTTGNLAEALAMMTTSLRVGSTVRRKGNWNSARTAKVVEIVNADTVRVWPFLGEGHDTWNVFDLELVPQPEIEALYYEAAKQTCHELGLPWTDPRTGKTHPAPKQQQKSETTNQERQ